MPACPPSAILTDIEGTTTPIAFVHTMLFPYARAQLRDFLAAQRGVAEVEQALADTRALAGTDDAVAALLGWMDADAKVTPLKTLQGLIWRQGYESGALRSQLYPDVPPALRIWHRQGLRLYVYSSGSVAAQQQIFGFSAQGDLRPLFSGFFDTRVGAKRAAESYGLIARACGLPVAEFLFLSDVAEELDAAATAGMLVCQLVRSQDGTIACGRHPIQADFAGVGEWLRQQARAASPPSATR